MLESPESAAALSIASITPTSTTLSDGLVVKSPLFILNGTCFMWEPPHLDAARAMPNGVGWEEWTQHEGEIWKLLELVDPKPEVLILGTGATVCYPPASVRSYLHSLGIQLDVQSSQNAASTFNVLSEEGRKVAVAVIPSQRQPLDKSDPERDIEAEASVDAPSSSSTIGRRTFSTSASTKYARPASPKSVETLQPSPKPEAAGRSDGSKGAPNLVRRRRLDTKSDSSPGLGLQHFVYRSQTLALYRSYLRATRPIPNPDARRETVEHLRHDVFDRFKGEVDLDRLREKLAWAHRELKLHQGSMLLSAHSPVGDTGTFAKLRGNRRL
ncbi:unnamed protein product [Parajaminaea phylloscopi]